MHTQPVCLYACPHVCNTSWLGLTTCFDASKNDSSFQCSRIPRNSPTRPIPFAQLERSSDLRLVGRMQTDAEPQLEPCRLPHCDALSCSFALFCASWPPARLFGKACLACLERARSAMQALGEAFDRDSSGVSEVDCVFVSISTAPLDTRWRHVRRGLGESLPPPPLPGPLSPSPPVAGPRRNRPGAWHLMCARMLSRTLQRTPMLIHGSAHRCYRHHARAVLLWAGFLLPFDGSGQ